MFVKNMYSNVHVIDFSMILVQKKICKRFAPLDFYRTLVNLKIFVHDWSNVMIV